DRSTQRGALRANSEGFTIMIWAARDFHRDFLSSSHCPSSPLSTELAAFTDSFRLRFSQACGCSPATSGSANRNTASNGGARGPFVDNRIIDLSFAAAREVESVGPGVVPVRVEVVSPGVDPTSGFFTVQVGAFRERANAERLRDRLSATYSPIFIQLYDSPDGVLYRVRVGRISGEDSAHQFSD